MSNISDLAAINSYINNVNQQNVKTSSNTSELGKNEFLQLLVTQLQNQDPMNPMDNQQFIAQLATFSSLEQLISINKGVTALADLSGASDANVSNTTTN